ncbi:MAG: cadherin-like domain-containing protein [Rhodobacteraceae bacterium]|nr:cadherin-like domain-containing protein [Paracoccaceae bacterium]
MQKESADMFIEDNNAFLMAMGEGSRIEIHAADAAKESWSQLNRTAQQGDTVLFLDEATGWEVGDKIAIASTDFGIEQAEELTIVKIEDGGRKVTIDKPLEYMHYGETETYSNGKSGADAKSWTLDMRAEVGLLSRNVTIQGDADSAADGYGGHTMVMDGGEMHISGAEFHRMGQEGILGKYPLHWHMLGDVSGQYIENTSIHQSFNKGITIHGSQNAWLEDNTIFDTIGHTYFFEDGSEFGNVLVDNLGFNTREAEQGKASHETDITGVSTYWIENPYNHFVGNHAGGSEHAGFWFTAQNEVLGASAMLDQYDGYNPLDQGVGVFDHNVGHSSVRFNLSLGNTNSIGNVGRQFERTDSNGDIVVFEINDFTSYKSDHRGIWGGWGSGGVFNDLKSASNAQGTFAPGNYSFNDSLFVGRSGNIGNPNTNTEREAGTSSGFNGDTFIGHTIYDRSMELKNVHFEGFSGGKDAALRQEVGVRNGTTHSVENVTFGEDTPEQNKLDFSGIEGKPQFITQQTYAIVDTDGSLTGVPGSVITPRYENGPSAKRQGDESITLIGKGFNAGEGAIERDDWDAWINPPDTYAGIIRLDGTRGNTFTITRDSNGSGLQNAGSDKDNGNQPEVIVIAGDRYTIDYDESVPGAAYVEIKHLPEGSWVILEFKDVPQNAVLQGADEVSGEAALQASEGTAYYQNGSNLVIKAVANNPFDQRSPTENQSVLDREFSDSFNIFSGSQANGKRPSGDYGFQDHRDYVASDRQSLPDRADSTSKTVDITNGDARWSDSGSWDKGVPDSNDIVIIEQGKRVVLDADVTVKGIIVAGGELIVEDVQDLALAADWVLVNNGGLFQVGTEENPHQNDFTLTLEGDDKEFDLDVMAALAADDANTVRATAAPSNEPQPEPQNSAPDARDDAVALGHGQSATIDVLANDLDADGDPLTVSAVEASGGVQADIVNGAVRVIADDGFSGGAVVRYEISDGAGGADSAEIAVSVAAAPTDPVGPDPVDPGPVDPGLTDPPAFHRVVGDALANILKGSKGADWMDGDAGDDTMRGDAGNDEAYGGAGRDIIRGGAGDDIVDGQGGDDIVVSGDRGDDTIYGRAGDDVLRGGADDDILYGGDGNDRVVGDRGDDRLSGGAGDDVLIGHLGDDFLIGGAGFDRLIGGEGADVYAFEVGGDRDVLVGFELGVDKIDVSAYEGLTAEEVLSQAKSAQAGGVRLEFGDGDSAIIRDVELADLSAGDFIVS